jgi:ribosomal-protein-alanine N-acetyltransferase
MLQGKTVNLRIAEKEDLPLVRDWFNNPEFSGEYDPLDEQQTEADVERRYDTLSPDTKWFIIEKKDGNKIGFIANFLIGRLQEVGYALVPNERNKGYGTEAVTIIVDYLFLSKDIVRIQAGTNVENKPSQRVLEKAGFTKEGIVRKEMFVRGKWIDFYRYSILREEWKKPRILTDQSSQMQSQK